MAVSAVYFFRKHSALLVRKLIQATPRNWVIYWRSLGLALPTPASIPGDSDYLRRLLLRPAAVAGSPRAE